MLKWILSLLAAIGFAPFAFGQAATNPGFNPFANTPSYAGSLPNAAVVPTAGVQQGAAGQVVSGNLGAAKELKKGCSSYPFLCSLALMAASQAAVTLLSKKSGGATGDGFKNNDFDVTPTGGAGDATGDTPPDLALQTEINKEIADLNNKGYKIDPKTGDITTPKGKFPARAFGSPQAMADAGIIGKDQIDEADNLIKNALKDKFKVISMGVGGGGGGIAASAPKTTYVDPYADAGSYYSDRERAQGPKTSGLTRTLASGESIGSQVDDIFKMVTRRYQVKAAENIFVDP